MSVREIAHQPTPDRPGIRALEAQVPHLFHLQHRRSRPRRLVSYVHSPLSLDSTNNETNACVLQHSTDTSLNVSTNSSFTKIDASMRSRSSSNSSQGGLGPATPGQDGHSVFTDLEAYETQKEPNEVYEKTQKERSEAYEKRQKERSEAYEKRQKERSEAYEKRQKERSEAYEKRQKELIEAYEKRQKELIEAYEKRQKELIEAYEKTQKERSETYEKRQKKHDEYEKKQKEFN